MRMPLEQGRRRPRPSLTLWLDESGDHGFPRPSKKKRGTPRPPEDYPPPLILGGPVLDTEMEGRLDASFNRRTEDVLGFPATLQRSSLFSRKRQFVRIPEDRLEGVCRAVEEVIKGLEFSYLAATCDKVSHRRRFGEARVNDFLPRDLYLMLFTFVVERFVAFLAQQGAIGRIALESRGSKEDAEVARVFALLFTGGTEYYQAWQFRERLVPSLDWFDKSDRKAGLQVADWLNWAIAKKVDGDDQYESEFEWLKERFWRGADAGLPGQVGLKTWPRAEGRDWLKLALQSR